jgi:hypothetical protein
MVALSDRCLPLVSSVVVVVVVLLAIAVVVSIIQRNRRSLVPQRGSSVGADLGALADQPRVRVESVTRVGPDRVRLVLTPEGTERDGVAAPTSSDLDLVVHLREDEVGFELINEWNRSGTLLAIVIPPGSRLVRLRSIDDLQPLTLRRDL